MPNDQTNQQVTFRSPTTGVVQPVPQEHWDEALQSGYRPVSHILMYDANGNRGMVPKEQAGVYRDQGYTLLPAEIADKRGFLGQLKDKLLSTTDVPGPRDDETSGHLRSPGGLPGPLAPLDNAVNSFVPNPEVIANTAIHRSLLRPIPKDIDSATYRLANAGSALIPGLDPEAQERASAKGDTGAVLAENAVPAAALAASTLGPRVIRSARESLAASAPEKAANLYERTVSPGGMKAEGQLEARQTFKQAAPYLAEQERQTPVINKQTAGQFAGQKLGVMNYRQNAQAAGQTLWNQITPRARMYENALLEPTKTGATASKSIASTVNPTEAQLNPGKVAGVQGLSDFYNKQMTVGEALDRIHELNNDKGVQAYENALPDKQADLLKGDPTIEGKITAANTLRDQVFDSIEKHGSADDANWIRKARSDFGSLTEVSKNLGNAQVPTPQPFLTRLANSARLTLSPTFAREYLSKPVDTLFDLNNPNRLAMKSSQALGRSTLAPSEPPPIRVTPWNPDLRPPGPVVGPLQGAPTPFSGGTHGPTITPAQEPIHSFGPGANAALFPDIPSGQAPSVTHAGSEVPNWPPKTPDWSPPNVSPSIPNAESTIPPTTPYGLPNELGPPPLPPGITQAQWDALPASMRKFGNIPKPGSYSRGGEAEVTPQGAPLPSAGLASSPPPTLPSISEPQGAYTPGPPEDAMEAARRGAPGINPTLRSLHRQFLLRPQKFE